MYLSATGSDADFEYFIPDEDAFLNVEEIQTLVGDKSVEERLESIDNNVEFMMVLIFFAVVISFASLVVYFIFKPIFYFFR